MQAEFFERHPRDPHAATGRRRRAPRAGSLAPAEREEARRQVADARRHARAAGLDWEALPRPVAHLSAPDRSGRMRVRRVDRREQTPASDTSTNADLVLKLEELVSRLTRAGSDAQARAGSDTEPSASEQQPTETLTGSAVWRWLHADPEAVHVNADGSAWYRTPDDGVWFRNRNGEFFGLAADGRSFFPLSDDGFLYAIDDDGQWCTWSTDGTSLTLREDGHLWRQHADGRASLLGDDGVFYLPAPHGVLYPLTASGEVAVHEAIGWNGEAITAAGALEGLPPPDPSQRAESSDIPLQTEGAQDESEPGWWFP